MSRKCDGIHCGERHETLSKLLREHNCYTVLSHGNGECFHVLPGRNYAAELHVLHHDYIKDVEEIAERARQQTIIPFCNRNGVRFDSGMGAYAFFDKEDREVSADWERGLNRPGSPPWEFAPADYPATYRVLNSPVGSRDLLFEFMSDYRPDAAS